ncbi:hypothetical protein ABPG74_007892 [Tetrahymena malaccensis]
MDKDTFLEEDSINNADYSKSNLDNSNQDIPKKHVKKQFILRKRIEEDIKNSKQYQVQNNSKLVQPQPQNLKKSFQNAARMISQASRASQLLNNSLGVNNTAAVGLLNESKTRETLYSQKSLGTENMLHMREEKKKVTQIEEQYKPQFNGPQVELVDGKKNLSFIINTGLVAFDHVIVRNNGSASIYYEWKRIESDKFNNSTLSDPEQKFFCHHEQNVIKPGQSKRFVFAFMSKVTGIFYEEWELQCEPPTMHPIQRLKLTGNAIDVDNLKDWRSDFEKESLNHYVYKGMNEIVGDIIAEVRTPTPPLPDLEDPEVCKREFEEKNEDLHVWYNPLVMKWWRLLEQDLYQELNMNPEHQYWDLNLNYIKQMVESVEDEDNKAFFESRYKTYFELSKVKPVERSQIFQQTKDFIWKLACNVPAVSDKVKEEMGMWEYVFRPPLQERDFTEQELKQFEDEKAKIKADWMKKAKKKKWTDDDEKKMIEDYRNQLSTRISNEVYQFFEGFEEKDALYRALNTVQTRKDTPSLEYFEHLIRKKPIKDLDIDGKRILLRVHLKLSSSSDALEKKAQHEQRIIQEKEEEQKRIEEEKALQEKLAKEKKKPTKRPPPPPAKGKGAKQQVEEEKPKEKILDISFLDEENLLEIMDSLKYILERQAKLVILMVSYDVPLGEYKLTSSIKFFVEYLKKQVENQIQFVDTFYIENFEEKIETESFPDNSILVLENCFFVPEEVGFKQIKQVTAEGKEETSLVKYTLEDKQNYISTLCSYCPSYVIEDKENFFSRLTSMVNFSFENQVSGVHISEDIQFASHLITFNKSPFHVFIGGSLTPSKLIAIDTLSNFAQQIHLYSEIGIKFLIVQQEIWQEERASLLQQEKQLQSVSSKDKENTNLSQVQQALLANSSHIILNMPFTNFSVSPIEKLAIQGVIASIKNRGKAQLILPQDFLVVPDSSFEGVEKFTPSWFEQSLQLSQNYPPRIVKQAVDSKANSEAVDQSHLNNSLLADQSPIQKNNITQEEDAVEDVDRVDEGEDEDEYEEYEDEEGTKRKKKSKNYNDVIEDVEDESEHYEYDYSAQFPANHIIIDFGEKTLSALRKGVRKSRKLAWFEQLSIFTSVSTNESNKIAAKTLHKMQEDKRARLESQRKENNDYNYVNDVLAFVFGKSVEKHVNMFELVDPKQKASDIGQDDGFSINSENVGSNQGQNKNEQQEEDKDKLANPDEDDKSVHSGTTAVTKPNTVRIISDFYSKDSEFLLKILHGTHIEALSTIESYAQKSESNLSDDLSFLDRL